MRWRWKMMIVAGAVAGAAAAAYGELVLDIRTPRASVAEVHAIGTNLSFQVSQLSAASEAAKKKYGPGAETVLTTKPPQLVTRVDGKVVEQHRTGQFSDAMGVFVIGQPGRLESIFPFTIDPRDKLARIKSAQPNARSLKSRFEKQFPVKYLEFDDRDAMTDKCIALSPADLGWAGQPLRFQNAIFCVMFWKGASPASMLIGVALAEGDPWIRPFSRRICRGLTDLVLARLGETDREPPPDYAACLLVDRPDRSGAAETLQEHVYKVRRNATLARVN